MLLKKYKKGGKAEKKKTTATNIETYEQIGSGAIDYPPSGRKTLKKQSGREFRKGLEGAPDLDNDLWMRYQSGGDMVLKQLVEEQRARDAKVKVKKMEKTGLKMPKSVGGSLPLGEGGKKTTDMPHGMYSVKKGVKGKFKPLKPKYKKAKLLKK